MRKTLFALFTAAGLAAFPCQAAAVSPLILHRLRQQKPLHPTQKMPQIPLQKIHQKKLLKVPAVPKLRPSAWTRWFSPTLLLP